MTAIRELSLSRKRIATYGKAARKRLSNNTAPLERCTDLSEDIRDTPSTPIKKTHTLATSSDVSSNYGIDNTNTTPKKRKTTHEIHTYGENLFHSSTNNHGLEEPFTSESKAKTRTLVSSQNIPIGNLMRRPQKGASSSGRLVEPPMDQGSKSGKSENRPFSRSPSQIQRKLVEVQDGGTQRARGSCLDMGNVVPFTDKLKNQDVCGYDFQAAISQPSRLVRELSSNKTPTHEYDKILSNLATTTPKGTKKRNGPLGKDCIEKLDESLSKNAPKDKYLKETACNADKNQLSPRRRLIDSLVDFQDSMSSRHSSPSLEEVLERKTPVQISTNTLGHCDGLKFPASFRQVAGRAEVESILDSGNQASQVSGPKITYSRQRSILIEKDIREEISFSLPLHEGPLSSKPHDLRGSISFPASTQSLHERAEADEEQAGLTIRTIHELRQAGANSRFVDEMEDLFDRVGNPSTRRSGLLDLTQKIKEKEFYQKFFSNDMEHRLYSYIGKERDVVSGFIITSLLFTLLDLGITPMAIVHRLQGMNRLFIRLLDVKDDIMVVAKDRKSNMSKYSQTTLSCQVQDLLNLRVWKGLQVESASPRTVALRFLELIIRQSRITGYTGEIISSELTEKIFDILKMHLRNGTWNLPLGEDLLDIQLALSALESHSLNAVLRLDESTLVDCYLPVLRSILESTLKNPSDEINVLQVSVVRLTLNATNNNPRASNVFATRETMHVMGQALVTNFRLLSKFMIKEDRIKLVDYLVLMLGIMMNFAECSVSARRCFHELKDSGQDPLDELVRIFVENLDRTFEADSVEDSQINVAFGWLAVFLGCLSLMPELESRIRIQQRTKTLRPLLASIDEFIGHHRKVDDLLGYETDGHISQASLTERLSRMVARLKTYEDDVVL